MLLSRASFWPTRQTDLAWHYLQLGNRIMAAHVSHDLLKEQRSLQQIKGLFRAPFVTSGLQDRSAIFIVGMPRSGSTLVEQMLASHPQVCTNSCAVCWVGLRVECAGSLPALTILFCVTAGSRG